MFAFGDFNIHYKDWLAYSVGTDRPSELCYSFSIPNNLIQMVKVATAIPDHDSHSPALLDFFFFFFFDVSICSTMAFLTLENFDHVVVSC